jgi:hypothetical protein
MDNYQALIRDLRYFKAWDHHLLGHFQIIMDAGRHTLFASSSTSVPISALHFRIVFVLLLSSAASKALAVAVL